jgi:excinuclease UvrABC ATPase subunit
MLKIPACPLHLVLITHQTLMKRKYIDCPVCKKKFVPQGLRNHIKNKAVNEVYKMYHENKTSLMPHEDYIKENTTTRTKQIIKLQVNQ